MSGSGMTVVHDGMAKFKKDIELFRAKNVLVGIPEQKNKRDDGEPIGNATLAYIQTKGSTIRNIPPSPFLEPGIKKEMDKIVDVLRVGAKETFNTGGKALTDSYTKAGIIGQLAAKAIIINQTGFEKLADSTIVARVRKGFKGTKRLIREGQLINAITFVIRNKN